MAIIIFMYVCAHDELCFSTITDDNGHLFFPLSLYV